MGRGYVPIVACVGATSRGDLLNVNADTLASHLAVGLRATRLVIAGGTAGVLDAEGRTIARVTLAEAARLVRRAPPTRGWWPSCRPAATRCGAASATW